MRKNDKTKTGRTANKQFFHFPPASVASFADRPSAHAHTDTPLYLHTRWLRRGKVQRVPSDTPTSVNKFPSVSYSFVLFPFYQFRRFFFLSLSLCVCITVSSSSTTRERHRNSLSTELCFRLDEANEKKKKKQKKEGGGGAGRMLLFRIAGTIRYF